MSGVMIYKRPADLLQPPEDQQLTPQEPTLIFIIHNNKNTFIFIYTIKLILVEDITMNKKSADCFDLMNSENLQKGFILLRLNLKFHHFLRIIQKLNY